MADYFNGPNAYFYANPNQFCLFNNFSPVQIITPFEMQNFFQYNSWQNQYLQPFCQDLNCPTDALESSIVYKQNSDQKKANITVQKFLVQKNNDSHEYSPHQQQSSRRGLQNQRRNVMPNLVHQILNFLNTESKSGVLVRKLLKSLGKSKNSYKKFYYYQKLVRRQIGRYINLKTFLAILNPSKCLSQQLVSQQEQATFSSIMRRLIIYFLKSEAVCVTIFSSKIKKQNRLYHFEAQKKMIATLKQQRQL